MHVQLEVRDLITVPKLSALELVVLANAKLELADFDKRGYANYDFVRGEGGKTYAVLVWQPDPGAYVNMAEVRRHFSGVGAEGRPAAFLAWIVERNPMGYHMCIPADDSLLACYSPSDDLRAPAYSRTSGMEGPGGVRELFLIRTDIKWRNWSFVAFREVK